MAAPDLIPVMHRVAALAESADRGARARRAQAYPADCRAILESLSGHAPYPDWKPGRSPDAASVSCLAKSVRILAAMLASTEGVHIPISGVLDDIRSDQECRF
ncbi:MAG: hypothetical protein OXH76_13175 [Boseongicola sp.]|nr:hypothetical protein [Boseongicola sp.]